MAFFSSFFPKMIIKRKKIKQRKNTKKTKEMVPVDQRK